MSSVGLGTAANFELVRAIVRELVLSERDEAARKGGCATVAGGGSVEHALESRWLIVAAIPGGRDVRGTADDNVRQRLPMARKLKTQECMFGFARG